MEARDAILAVHARTTVVPRGLGPRTLRLLAVRSNQLNYETSCVYILDLLGVVCLGCCPAVVSLLLGPPLVTSAHASVRADLCSALWPNG